MGVLRIFLYGFCQKFSKVRYFQTKFSNIQQILFDFLPTFARFLVDLFGGNLTGGCSSENQVVQLDFENYRFSFRGGYTKYTERESQ